MISYDLAAFGMPLQQVERPTPPPQGGEIPDPTLGAGARHSDLHIWERG